MPRLVRSGLGAHAGRFLNHLARLKLVLSDSARLEVETPYLPAYVGARLQQIFLKNWGLLL